MTPDWSRAEVSDPKLVSYLLALDHPEGGPKARFFHRCGFSVSAPDRLAAALREQAIAGTPVSIPGVFGVKWLIDGPITGPDGRSRQVRTVWIVEAAEGPARFVTAYPLEVRLGDS